MNRIIALSVLVLLVGCGALPQPFLGRPGPEGALLSVPPPPVLIVPPPHAAMLGNTASQHYATDLAEALVDRDVPSLVRPAEKQEWLLIAHATLSGDQVTPSFSIVGPTNKIYGQATGALVPAVAWASGDPAILKAAAEAVAPELASQLGSINARIQQSNPLSLENRPPRAMLQGVTGAPGDGDHALGLNLTRDLGQLGVVIVTDRQDADFIIAGLVKVSPQLRQAIRPSSDVVELDWIVRSQNGSFIGKVSQLHELQAVQMAPYWGDVAAAAAEQAALGLKQVILNATPKRLAAASATPGNPLAHAKSATPPAP